jgi:L-2-hydroxyglutarate oxidase LhgO
MGAERATTDFCGIGAGVMGADRATTDFCGIGAGVMGAERAMTDFCGIGAGVIGAAIRTEVAEMSRIAVRARRIDSFTGAFFLAHNCA